MDVQVRARLTGLKVTDFEKYQFLTLYVLQDIKGQDTIGQKTHPVRLNGLGMKDSVSSMVNSEVILTGSMESDDKGQSVFVASSVKPASGAVPQRQAAQA